MSDNGMFWDQEIYCYPDGRSTGGFWSKPSARIFNAYFGGKFLGKFHTRKKAICEVEIAFADAQAIPPDGVAA
jgi:hypothetical protein